MTDTILLATKVPRDFLATLNARYEVLGPIEQPFDEKVLALPTSDARRVRAILTLGSVKISESTLDLFPNLGVISCQGSGFEGAPVAAARARGIEVTHSADANAASVADHAVGLLIASARDFSKAREFLRAGQWQGNTGVRMPAVRGLTGRRIGIYGLGAIGLKIAQRVAAFETEVGYHNRKRREDVGFAYYPSLPELAHWADVLIIAVRAGVDNRHAVNRDVLTALGADGIVVNISRGSVIDEKALIDALDKGVIAGAGLDVFEHEPDVPQALYDLPRVVVSPHIGGNTHEAQHAMQRKVLANLEALFAGRALPNPVPG